MGQPGSSSPAVLLRQAEQLHLVDKRRVIVLAGRAYTTAARQVWPHTTAPLARAGVSADSWRDWPPSPNPPAG